MTPTITGTALRRLRLSTLIASVFVIAGMLGCSTEDSGIKSRQDQALKDPFSYGPAGPPDPRKKPEASQPPPPKDNRSDWDRFWNP